MGILGSISKASMLLMFHLRQQLLFRRTITAERIGDQHPRNILVSFEELAKELLSGSCIPAALHQDIQHVPMLINCTPQILPLASDREENLIEVPLVAGLWPTPAQLVGVLLTKCLTSLTNRFIRQDNAPFGHEFFYIPIPESEAEVQPHGVADTLGREAIALV